MLPITYFLIANPFIALGLIILIALCIYNVFRRQVRVALGLWALIIVVLFYIHIQAGQGMEDEMSPESRPESGPPSPSP